MHPLKRPAAVSALAALALLIAVADPAGARSRGEASRDDFAQTRPAGVPLLAVVSLNDQRVTIYDAEGKVLRAPVSTGQTGYETPAGIYSIIEKNREHYSNLYDDASMPFMQRITWSGIALHAGVLPGRPASHGCIRLPYRFAEQLFDLTKMGMRVVVVRDDMSPVDIAHPALFKPGPVRPEVALRLRRRSRPPTPWSAARCGSACRRRTPARRRAPRHGGRSPPPRWPRRGRGQGGGRGAGEPPSEPGRTRRAHEDLRMAEGARQRAEAQLRDAERMLEAARSPEATQKAEEIKAKAAERLTEAQAKLDAVKAEAQPKIDAAEAARAAANAAEAARAAAEKEVKLAEAKMAPVSVFISRKTQRLYVRQAFQPIFDTEVTIRDPDTPIGTTIYTALSYANDGDDVRWSALAMYANGAGPDAASAPSSRRGGERKAEGAATDAAAAKAALERITIPQEAIDRINEVVSPGSSLIVSDEPMSAKETGKGTDFIVLMSGEPQGGIKSRPRRSPYDGSTATTAATAARPTAAGCSPSGDGRPGYCRPWPAGAADPGVPNPRLLTPAPGRRRGRR